MEELVRLRPPSGAAKSALERVHQDIEHSGVSVLDADEMFRLTETVETTREADAGFFRSWDKLCVDEHMADGGRYRLRRHSCLRWRGGDDRLLLEAHRPHYQSVTYNAMNGGLHRWFEPLARETLGSPRLHAMLNLFCSVAAARNPGADWRLELHQFRIAAQADEPAYPTPEGMHRDGVDFVAITLIDRVNVSGATTTVAANDGAVRHRAAMVRPLETLLLDDHRVQHGVSPMHAAGAGPAHRDILVVTFADLASRKP